MLSNEVPTLLARIVQAIGNKSSTCQKYTEILHLLNEPIPLLDRVTVFNEHSGGRCIIQNQ